jgi:hypothetical protein
LNAFKAIEKLNWKIEELKKLDEWIVDLDVNNRPIDGIHWRKLRVVLKNFADEMQEEIVEMETKIENSIGEIEIDI